VTKTRVLPFLAALSLLLMLPTVASAQQAPPHVFIGTVTMNGLGAPIGTTLTASIDGLVQGSTTVQAGGKYMLKVNQSTGGAISFKIGNLVAAESATWEHGGATLLDLNAGATQDSVINQDTVGAVSFKIGDLVDDESAISEQEGGPVLDLNAARAGGAKAPLGPQSAKGDTGDSGERSPTGPSGAEGPAGPAGEPGAAGPAGPAGAEGPTGPTAPAGAEGPAGPAAPAGAEGPAGPAGSAGPASSGGVLSLTGLFVAIIALVGVVVVYFVPRPVGKAKAQNNQVGELIQQALNQAPARPWWQFWR